MRAESTDVVVVGAGVAGLACARSLLDEKLEVIVLEARDRVGGRAFTTRFPELDLPIELGAEFIHGAAKETVALADRLGLVWCDADEGHLQTHGEGKADAPVDDWDRMEALFDQLDPKRTLDRSVAEFLEARKRTTDAQTLKLAAAFVEGFHAADLNLIGERGLASAEQVSEGPSISRAARLLRGYQALVDGLFHGLQGEDPARARVRLSRVVKTIAWKRRQVIVSSHSRAGFALPPIRARQIVVTAPLGVLQAPRGAEAAIAFEPEPKGFQEMLRKLHMGHAMRIAFLFRSRFWEEVGPADDHGKIDYLHAGAELNFPTWWTAMPVRAPVLVAWQGGPRAARLAMLPESDRVNCALDTLQKLLGCPRARIESELQGWATHDWSHDPFSLGAYSYIGVGGSPAAETIQRPIEETLYFAGEATSNDTARGTVEGAIESGLRAARQILGKDGRSRRGKR